MEDLINNWNVVFPDYQLTPEELKMPISLMGAVLQVFERLGIDYDAVIMQPSERNLFENGTYFGDLLPVINITRIINSIVAVPQTAKITINHFLQPTVATSTSILLLLFNLMLFYEEQSREIAPYEEELFNVAKLVKELEQKKNNLVEQLNSKVAEKAKRAERVEQMEKEIHQLEEEFQAEEHARDQEKQEYETLLKENNATEVLLDQKRATKEGLLAERERKRALRVYDADEIRAKASQASQSVQEAEEKVNSLQSILAKKENSLKILQLVKPNLDTANSLLREITKIKESDLSSLDEESQDGELEVLNNDLWELKAQAADVSGRRADAARKRQEAASKRYRERAMADIALNEAEEKDKKRREFISKATQRIQEIKQQTVKYEEEKKKVFEQSEEMQDNFNKTIKEWKEELTKLVIDLKKDMETLD